MARILLSEANSCFPAGCLFDLCTLHSSEVEDRRGSDTSMNTCDSKSPSFPLPPFPDWIFELFELISLLLAQLCYGKVRSNI